MDSQPINGSDEEQRALLKQQVPSKSSSGDAEEDKRTLRRNFWNVTCMAIAFCVVFCGFIPTQGYMTSINHDLGNISLFIVYFVFAFANFFTPYLVKSCGVRASMYLGSFCYSVYTAATISSAPALLLPASVVIGIGSATLWTAQGDYLSRCSNKDNIGFLSGVFFGIYQVAGLVGSVGTGIIIDRGANDQLVFTILTGVALFGVILFVFCRRVEPGSGLGAATAMSAKQGNPFQATLRLMSSKRFVLLVGITLFSGFSQAFYAGIFPPVVKETGKSNVAWFLAIWGTAEIIGSFATGKLSDMWGRTTVVYVGLATWVLGFATALVADQMEDIRLPMSFVCGFFLGLGDACLNTSLYAIFGVIFRGRAAAAFAGFKGVQSLALGAGFGLGIVLSATWYSVMSLGVLVVAFFMFLYLQRNVVDVNIDTEEDEVHNDGDEEEAEGKAVNSVGGGKLLSQGNSNGEFAADPL